MAGLLFIHDVSIFLGAGLASTGAAFCSSFAGSSVCLIQDAALFCLGGAVTLGFVSVTTTSVAELPLLSQLVSSLPLFTGAGLSSFTSSTLTGSGAFLTSSTTTGFGSGFLTGAAAGVAAAAAFCYYIYCLNGLGLFSVTISLLAVSFCLFIHEVSIFFFGAAAGLGYVVSAVEALAALNIAIRSFIVSFLGSGSTIFMKINQKSDYILFLFYYFYRFKIIF